MSVITCPACANPISADAKNCPNCGNPVASPQAVREPSIRRMSGKLQAIGVVVLASGIIATVLGAWWGPAIIFPGIIVFLLGRFL